MSKVSVVSNGKRYNYDYEKVVVMLDEDTAQRLRKYADKFFPRLNSDGNLNASVRHILNAVFELEANPEVEKLINDDMSMNDDICMMIRKMADSYIKQKDMELDDESWATF